MPAAVVDIAPCRGIRCVGVVGPEDTPVFVLSLSNDTDSEDALVHVVWEARPVSGAPAEPCVDGTSEASLSTPYGELPVLRCSAELTVEVLYGEDSHAGHLLTYWDQEGIRSVVSIHGHNQDARHTLAELAASTELIDGP